MKGKRDSELQTLLVHPQLTQEISESKDSNDGLSTSFLPFEDSDSVQVDRHIACAGKLHLQSWYDSEISDFESPILATARQSYASATIYTFHPTLSPFHQSYQNEQTSHRTLKVPTLPLQIINLYVCLLAWLFKLPFFPLLYRRFIDTSRDPRLLGKYVVDWSISIIYPRFNLQKWLTPQSIHQE